MPLTEMQRRLLDYLAAYIGEHRLSPTYQEIAAHFGWRSRSTVHAHLQRLSSRGVIRIGRGRARSIELLRTDDRERPYRAVFPPPAWLRERVDAFPAPPSPVREAPLPVQHRARELWRVLREGMRGEDQLWSFHSPEESWREHVGRAGYAVVRGGAVVDGVLVWDQWSDPGA